MSWLNSPAWRDFASSRSKARLLVALPIVLFVACNTADKLISPLTPSGRADAVGSSTGAVVISQIYGGGGNSGATLKNDFIELHNNSTSPVSLSGWSVQYASSAGITWQVTLLNGSIAPGGYYLVQESQGAGGTTNLPTPDATGTIAMSATAGKVVVVHATAALAGSCPTDVTISDLVGFGTGANCFEGIVGSTSAVGNTTAAFRLNGGVTDNGDSRNDFSIAAPAPRNTASPAGGTSGAPPVVGPLDHVVITGGAASVTVGGTLQFTAAGQDANNQALDPATVTITWETSDATIATVDNTGKVTAVAATASPVTLTATAVSGGITKTATTDVTVTPPAPVATVTVTPAVWSLKAGTTKQLVATATDANGVATPTTFAWASADPTIATVDASGLVTGKLPSANAVLITATSANGKSASASVTVTSAATLSLNSGKTSLAFAMQTQFFFSGADGSGTPVTTVVWSTSDASVISADQNGIVTGKGVGTANLIATAQDGTTATKAITIYIAAGSSNIRLGHNTEFGEPKDADPSDDFLIRRPQYTVSYNPKRGGANWVSWNLDASHVGSNGRCVGTCYSADTALTNAGLPAYTTADWVSGATYDRGHMAPSADWTSSEADNNTTFFLTNFVPQRPDLNQGPWEVLESALRDSVAGGREAYIIDGGIFTNGVGLGTLLNLGKIGIPDSTWKIAIITPAGSGLNVDGSLPPNTTVLAVNMPNVQGIRNNDWRTWITTIDKIQHSTGYDFLALLREDVQCRVEVRNCAPSAHITGAGVAGGGEGQLLSFSASTSSDPDAGDVLTYAWSINGQPVGNSATLDHVFTNDGSFVVTLVVSDGKGGNDTTTTTVVIQNVAPSVNAFATSSTAEGSAFSSSGSFTDPGDDSWSATVDYGDASGAQPLSLSGKSFTLSHTYADNGSYVVTVTVSETNGSGASGSSTSTIAVTNVAPTVAAFNGATILAGEVYTSSGTFSDPGADTWSAAVNYGDGTGAQALALNGSSFSLTHVYATAGTFSAAVSVTDKDGGVGTTSATVMVLSGTQSIAQLNTQLGTLGGALNKGELNSLAVKLDNASKSLQKGNAPAAANQLGAFINELQAEINAGQVDTATGGALVAYAQRVIASIGG
jgi:DNA/RNA endonuclease G (NUC1)